MNAATLTSVISEIRGTGVRASTSADVVRQHGVGESYHAPAPPDVVVYPRTTDDVSRVVRICARSGTPVIPFGAGTSLEGNVSAVRGGVCVDLTDMNAILAVNVDDLDATVEAGVTRMQLDDHLRHRGVFFPVDPGADATLGGMASTRASGTLTVRYGGMRENVLGLVVVLADGRVIRTASRARKSAAGYDLTRLFVGSEGTLGVITEVTVRLVGVPEAISAAACVFPSVDEAVGCGMAVIQLGVPVARMEFLDDVAIGAVNRHAGLDHAVGPTLFFEFHGTPAGVAEHAAAVDAIATGFGGAGFRWSAKAGERNRIWRARHDAYNAARALRPGSSGFVTDVCVPISRLGDCIRDTRRDLDTCGLTAPMLGHIGDGNFHVFLLVDPHSSEEIDEAMRIAHRLGERAVDMGGTCTGEHGIGSGKIDLLQHELGQAVDVMKAVKSALDPIGIMNPGKIFRSSVRVPAR